MGKDANKVDIYEEITNKIVSTLEGMDHDQWEAPFAQLAAQGWPFNPTTNSHYQGVNVAALWLGQQERGFRSNHWATFKQWKDHGACVRKGERACRIIFFKTILKTQDSDNGEADIHVNVPVLRCYSVFNADQVEGYDPSEVETEPTTNLVERLEAVETFCARTSADIRRSGSQAYYDRKGDFINIPNPDAFNDTSSATATENYYATLLHELTHWTGAPHRLNRDKAQNPTDREKYAFEELIAELGSAFLCAQLGITQTPRDDHAHYLKNWLQALKNDKKYIFQASAGAARACEYLFALQQSENLRS